MRVTMDQARAFAARRGSGALVHTSFNYLELADGNVELANLIADYYQGTGREKTYTVGELIKDFWINWSKRGDQNGF